jgi:hypothetical protein
MIVCELDIWRAANLLIKRHGPYAAMVCRIESG